MSDRSCDQLAVTGSVLGLGGRTGETHLGEKRVCERLNRSQGREPITPRFRGDVISVIGVIGLKKKSQEEGKGHLRELTVKQLITPTHRSQTGIPGSVLPA